MFLMLLLGCNQNKNKNCKTILPDNYYADSSYLNAYADFIAGTKFSKKYFNQNYRKIWDNYSLEIQSDFKFFKDKILNDLDTFSMVNITPNIEDSAFVFYPFSGPDVIFLNHFFPTHNASLLVGLEPVGKIPDLTIIDTLSLKNYLNNLRNSLLSYFNYGFYLTEGMNSDFQDSILNGSIHHLLFFLAQENCQIKKIETLIHNENGEKSSVPFNNNSNAICVEYFDSNANKLKEVSYYSMNLCDSTSQIAENKGFFNFLKSKDPFCFFIKSGSYLLHSPNFSQIKNIILNNAKFIVQDDSGLLYKDLLDNWTIKLFGNYKYLMSPNDIRFQEDLYNAYAVKNSEELPFRMGYSITYDEHNLLIAWKKNTYNKIEK